MADMLALGSGIREEVVTAAKKATGVAVGAEAGAAKGIGAVVLAVATVVMVSADNSGNDGAGNVSRIRGSGGATTINQNASAVEAKTAVVAAGMDVAALVAAVAAAAVASVKRQGQIIAAAAMVITRFTLGGAVPRMDPNWQQTATFWHYFCVCRVYLRGK